MTWYTNSTGILFIITLVNNKKLDFTITYALFGT